MKELTEQEEIKRNEKLTRAVAMRQFCLECAGVDFGEPRVSCQNPTCPMFRWMPYRKKFDKEFEKEYPELAKELVKKKKPKKKLSEAHKKALQEGRKKKLKEKQNA